MQRDFERTLWRSMVQIRTNKILEWTDDVLACKLATPIDIVVQKHSRFQCTVQLVWLVLEHGRRRPEHDKFPMNESTTFVLHIPWLSNDRLVRRFLPRFMRYRIGIDSKTVPSKRPKAVR